MTATAARTPLLSSEGRLVLGLIAAATLLRLVTAAAMGLGMDEVLHHRPSRATCTSPISTIRPCTSWIAHAAGEAFGYGRWVRAPFIALSAGSTWLMYRLGARLFGRPAGAWAALAFNLTAFFGVAAGTLGAAGRAPDLLRTGRGPEPGGDPVPPGGRA
ncbi:MAG: hypothetical protein WDN45_10610 [Caulobacteraceae bacterium]